MSPRTAAPRKSAPQQESLRQRTARRSGKVIAFSRKHGGSVVSWTGLAGLTVCAGMWAFTGTVYLVAGTMCAVGAVGGAALAHHQRNDVVNGPNSQRVPWSQKQHAEDAYRRGEEFDPGNRTVTVQSHARDGSGVRSHTRAAPGQAKTRPSTSSWAGASRSDGSRGHPSPAKPSGERNWGGESGWGQPVAGFGGKWIKGDTDVDGRPFTEHERRNARNYAEWRADPSAPGDYWDHQRGRAISEAEMEADRKGRYAWQYRHSVFQDERTGEWEDAWGRPVDDPDVHRDRSRLGDDPDSWT